MLAALVILLFMFGSFLAASLPLITAVFAVGTTFGFVALMSHVATIPDYTPPILVLVGLGVGIDYSLLVFARYRAEILGGADRELAARTALDTAGRSVLFAGATVVIALLGLYTLNLGSLEGVALSVTLTVLMTMVASLVLLPSLLTIFGSRSRSGSASTPPSRRPSRAGAGGPGPTRSSGGPGPRWSWRSPRSARSACLRSRCSSGSPTPATTTRAPPAARPTT